MSHLHCFPKVKSEVTKQMAGSSHHSTHLNFYFQCHDQTNSTTHPAPFPVICEI